MPMPAPIFLLFSCGLSGPPPDSPFATLAELEMRLLAAPQLKMLRTQIEKNRTTRHWTYRVRLSAHYSQHFSSLLPLVPTSEEAVSAGTSVGVSASLPLSELLGRPTLFSFDHRLLLLEYEKLFQEKLAELRRLYWRRQQLQIDLRALSCRQQTARLQRARLQQALELIGKSGAKELLSLPDPIQLSQADERLAILEGDLGKTQFEILRIEAEIWALLGRGTIP